MRISDWSSDVCSSDLVQPGPEPLSDDDAGFRRETDAGAVSLRSLARAHALHHDRRSKVQIDLVTDPIAEVADRSDGAVERVLSMPRRGQNDLMRPCDHDVFPDFAVATADPHRFAALPGGGAPPAGR